MNAILIPWVIVSTVLLFVGAYWIYMLEQRLRALETRQEKILALAEEADQVTVVQFLTRLNHHEEKMQQIEAALQHFATVLPHTIQGYSVVRYNAFENVGGDQSFSMALVDEIGNGVLLSGIHARGDTRVYAKPLMQWRSAHSLSAEEQQALGQARHVAEGKIKVVTEEEDV